MYSVLVRECRVRFWALQYERDMAILEQVQQRVMKIIKGLEHHSHKEKLRELEPEKRSLEQRKLREVF